jgi:hypothetical protein
MPCPRPNLVSSQGTLKDLQRHHSAINRQTGTKTAKNQVRCHHSVHSAFVVLVIECKLTSTIYRNVPAEKRLCFGKSWHASTKIPPGEANRLLLPTDTPVGLYFETTQIYLEAAARYHLTFTRTNMDQMKYLRAVFLIEHGIDTLERL